MVLPCYSISSVGVSPDPNESPSMRDMFSLQSLLFFSSFQYGKFNSVTPPGRGRADYVGFVGGFHKGFLCIHVLVCLFQMKLSPGSLFQ